MVKSRRVEMGEACSAHTKLIRNPERSRHKWKDNIKSGFKKLRYEDTD
jgi:hypothetical protein